MDPEVPKEAEFPLARGRALVLAAVLIATDGWLSARYGLGVRVLVALSIVGLERLATRRPLRLTWGEWTVSLGNTVGTALVCAALVAVAALVLLGAHKLTGFSFEHAPQNVRSRPDFWPYVGFACGLVPIAEELIYRGLLQVELARAFGRWRAVWIAGPIFWTYHWWSYGGVTPLNHILAGWILAWSFERTRSLLAPTLLHALGNLLIALIDLALLTYPETMSSLFGVH